MSGPYGQPGYNPQYQNPYGAPGPQGAQSQSGYFVPPPMPHPSMMNANPHYAEDGHSDKYNLNFSDRTIRAAFVRKVFALVAIMLGVVSIMTAIPFLHDDTRLFVKSNIGMYWAAYGVFFVVYLSLMCCESVRRSFPANIIMTAIFVCCIFSYIIIILMSSYLFSLDVFYVNHSFCGFYTIRIYVVIQTLAVGYMTMMITVHHDIQSVLLTLIICTIYADGWAQVRNIPRRSYFRCYTNFPGHCLHILDASFIIWLQQVSCMFNLHTISAFRLTNAILCFSA
uniref:Protein lifeguard 1 n=1 Tax=Heterorhabditis bacteriophora TaxID=37862 RepID=A0A1I7XFF1_HETBA